MRLYIIQKINDEPARISQFDSLIVQSIELMDIYETDIKKNIQRMCNCDLIVTKNGWEDCQTATKAVHIARMLEIEIVHESRFQAYVEQKNN